MYTEEYSEYRAVTMEGNSTATEELEVEPIAGGTRGCMCSTVKREAEMLGWTNIKDYFYK